MTLLLLNAGCADTTPTAPRPEVVAFSGNEQNGGIVRALPDGGWEITPGARDRYNAFIDHYGKDMMPPIKKDFGVEAIGNGNYSMTFEAAAKWRRMILYNHREAERKAGGLVEKIGL